MRPLPGGAEHLITNGGKTAKNFPPARRSEHQVVRHRPGHRGVGAFSGVDVMTTRSRIAFLVACSAAALGLTTASAFAADAPAAGQPAAQSAPQHAGKKMPARKMAAHHAKTAKSHPGAKTHHAQAPKTPA
jgi:hypothetical protein